MPLDGITPAVVLPALHFAFRTFQTGFELAAVPKQTQDVLDTISQVTADLKSAGALRRKKSRLLDQTEKEDVDRTIQSTEKVLEELEALVERARVDMVTKPENIRFTSRVLWIIKDASNVDLAMTRLGVVFAALNREITFLRGLRDTRFDDNLLKEDEKAPPPYQDARNSLYLRRQSTKGQFTLHVSPVERSSPMTEMESRVRGISGSEATLSSLSRSGEVRSPLSQPEPRLLSQVSKPDQEVLLRRKRRGREVNSTHCEDFVSSISETSKLASAQKSTSSPLLGSERKAGPQARPGDKPSSISHPELAQIPSTSRGCEGRHSAKSHNKPNPVATDRCSSRSSTARSLRQSRSRSWLAFQASRPLPPTASPTLR